MLQDREEGIRSARDLFLVEVLEDQPQTTLEACPSCGGADIWPEYGAAPYGLYCRSCQWGGPRASASDDDPDKAIAAWNAEARKVRQARALGLAVNLVPPRPEAEDVC
jgi:hypothetical protein